MSRAVGGTATVPWNPPPFLPFPRFERERETAVSARKADCRCGCCSGKLLLLLPMRGNTRKTLLFEVALPLLSLPLLLLPSPSLLLLPLLSPFSLLVYYINALCGSCAGTSGTLCRSSACTWTSTSASSSESTHRPCRRILLFYYYNNNNNYYYYVRLSI